MDKACLVVRCKCRCTYLIRFKMMEVEGSLSDDENRNLFAEDETEVEEERNNPDDYAVEVPSTQQGLFSNYQLWSNL